MLQRLRGRQAPVAGTQRDVDQGVAGLVEVHLAAQDAGAVEVDVLAHLPRRLRIGGQLDHRLDRVADDVALPGREEVHNEAGRGLQGHALRRSGGAVHEVEARPLGRFLGGLQHVDELRLPADLLQVAEGLLLDGGEAAGDVALGRLAVGEVAGLVRLDDLVHVGLPGIEELLAHFRRGRAGRADLLGAGQFRGLAKAGRGAQFIELVDEVAHRRVGREARGRVRLAALGGDPEVVDRAGLALQLGGRLHVLFGLARGVGHHLDLAVAFDGEALDRLAGLGDAVDHAAGPLRLDADDDDGGDVGIAAGADQGAEVQLQVFTELQAPIVVRQGQAALDVVRHLLAGGIGKVVQGQDDHVIADADPAVLAAVAEKCLRAHLTTSSS